MSIKDVLTKTTVQNFCAGFILIFGFIYACYTRNDELIKAVTYAALGFIFGTVSANGSAARAH